MIGIKVISYRFDFQNENDFFKWILNGNLGWFTQGLFLFETDRCVDFGIIRFIIDT